MCSVSLSFPSCYLQTLYLCCSLVRSNKCSFSFAFLQFHFSTGSMGVAWAIIWFLVVKNSPAEDSHISEEERLFIENSLANDIQKKVQVWIIILQWHDWRTLVVGCKKPFLISIFWVRYIFWKIILFHLCLYFHCSIAFSWLIYRMWKFRGRPYSPPYLYGQ